MGFLEDLRNGDIKSIILVIFGVLIFYQYWCLSSVARSIKENQCKDTKELMSNVSQDIKSNVSNDIKEAVKQVYLADVEAIRNLSDVATKLQKEGLIIPGDLTIKGQITCEKKINGLTLSELNTKIDSVNSSHNTNNTNLNNNISSLQRYVRLIVLIQI